ncbi:unnamed protein product [Mytilus coruscus]|uniref:CCHC-type domain-containing protein n=1 Tax=Mytilus coruscus TaxID=42192 RepID=A0A6J8CIW8_MYTCO|nr:unnamed protein product [Mytilus coruscus]
MSNNQNMIPEQQNENNKQDLDGKQSEIDKSQSDGSDKTSAPSVSNVVKHHSVNYQAYSDPEPKLKGVKPIFIKESDFFGNKTPPKELWITHVEIYKALEHKIKPQFVRGIQRIKQMWRIYLDSEVDRMLLLTEGITLRNKSVPLHSQNPYYQKDEYITTTVRVKNIPLSADDGKIDRELRQRNIEVFTINRERLRVDNLVTNCWTGDRVVICNKFDKPLPRFLTIGQYTASIYLFGQLKDTDMFLCNKCQLKGHNIKNCPNEWKCRLCNEYGQKMFDCPTFLAKKMGKNSETEKDEQQETTAANVDENTNTEERQQIEALTENDKKDDTDEQPELTDGDDEDNLTHSMSLNKEITAADAKKKKKKRRQKRKETKLQLILLKNRHQNRQKQKEILQLHNLTFQKF